MVETATEATVSAVESATPPPLPPPLEAGGGAARRGHAVHGAGRCADPPPKSSSPPRPLAVVKFHSAAAPSPGHSVPRAQGAHAGGDPTVPGPQPAQLMLAFSATASGTLAAHALGRSGDGHTSGAHCARDVGTAPATACVPEGHVKGSARHCASTDAPLAIVINPGRQGRHASAEAAPVVGKKKLKSHGVGASAPAAAQEPAGASTQRALAPVA